MFREEQPWGSFLFQEFGGEEVLPLGLLEALDVGLLMSLSLLLGQLLTCTVHEGLSVSFWGWLLRDSQARFVSNAACALFMPGSVS